MQRSLDETYLLIDTRHYYSDFRLGMTSYCLAHEDSVVCSSFYSYWSDRDTVTLFLYICQNTCIQSLQYVCGVLRRFFVFTCWLAMGPGLLAQRSHLHPLILLLFVLIIHANFSYATRRGLQDIVSRASRRQCQAVKVATGTLVLREWSK